MKKQELEKVEKTVLDLFSDLGIEVTVKIESGLKENDLETVNLQIDSDQAAALIGFHGETLQALQLILSFLIRQSLDRWIKVVVNVGDYWKKREEQLQKLALNLAMKAKFSGEQQIIPNLSAAERRIVHLALADRSDIYTQSEGEGRQRQLTIRTKLSQ